MAKKALIEKAKRKPKFQVNPVSAIAPGIFRRIFQIGGGEINETPGVLKRILAI